MPESNAHAFLRAVGSVLELPDLSFNDDAACCLFVPGDLEVQIEWVRSEGRLLFLAPLGALSEDPDGARARALLSANFLFAGTRGETLSLEPDTRVVFLCSMVDIDLLGVDHAFERFTQFVDTARQWCERLAASELSLPASGVIPHHHLRA